MPLIYPNPPYLQVVGTPANHLGHIPTHCPGARLCEPQQRTICKMLPLTPYAYWLATLLRGRTSAWHPDPRSNSASPIFGGSVKMHPLLAVSGV